MTKKGTKLVCIDNSNLYTKINKSKKKRCAYNYQKRLTIGKIYEQLYDQLKGSSFVYVIADNGSTETVNQDRFKTLAEHRDEQINSILND
jgi:hypothetical protein